MRYAMIDELRLKYPVTGLCDLLDLSVSGYYSWRNRPMSSRAQEEARLEVVIRAAHKRTREICGPERLQQDIAAHDGVQVGVHRVKRIRKQLGLRCKQKQKFKATTNSKHSLPGAEIRGNGSESGLANGYNLYSHRRRLVVPGWAQGYF